MTPAVVLTVARRPDLWWTAVAAIWSLAPTGWWRRPPFLPIPDARWLAFRLEAAYGGDGSGPMRPDDVITWLEWKRRR